MRNLDVIIPRRYGVMEVHDAFFQKRYALSGLFKKRYSVMDPTNPTLIVIGVFFVQRYGVMGYFSQESVMAL